MSEEEFAELVDCQLPYGDDARCAELISLAADISLNASFIVLAEILLPPSSIKLDSDSFFSLLSKWRSSVEDPLAEPFSEYATEVYQQGIGSASPELGEYLFAAVRDRTDLFAAASIVAMGGDPELERRCLELCEAWNAAPLTIPAACE